MTSFDDEAQAAMVSAGELIGMPYINYGVRNWPLAVANELLLYKAELTRTRKFLGLGVWEKKNLNNKKD